jgi:hypothetical protein
MSWTRSLSALDILASSGMAVIGEADGEAAVDAGGGVEVGAAIGVKVSAGVGVGGGTGLTDRPQLSVKNPIRRRENARRPLLRFRPILKNIRSKCDLCYCRLQGRFGVAALEC